MPQKIRGNNAFRPSQQTFGAVVNTPADGLSSPSPDGSQAQPTTTLLASSTLPPPAASSSSMPPPRALSSLPHPASSIPDFDDDDDDEIAIPPSTPALPPTSPALPPTSVAGSIVQSQSSSSTKRKFSAQGDHMSTSSSGKRQRSAGGGAAALQSLSQGVNVFNSQFGAFIDAARKGRSERQERQEPSPERRAKAQDIVQEDHSSYLNPEQVVLICDVIETNTRAADTFLNYKKFEYRRAWVEMQLKHAGHQLNNAGMDVQ